MSRRTADVLLPDNMQPRSAPAWLSMSPAELPCRERRRQNPNDDRGDRGYDGRDTSQDEPHQQQVQCPDGHLSHPECGKSHPREEGRPQCGPAN